MGVTYTVVVSNAGPSDAVGATVTDAARLARRSQAGRQYSPAELRATRRERATSPNRSTSSGGSITYTINVSVPSSLTDNLVNTTTVTAPMGTTDPTPGNNTATDTDTPNLQADLSITKTDGSATYTPGVGVTYMVVVSNAGPSDAVGATIVDAAPAGTTISSWTAMFAGGATGNAAGAGNISETVNILGWIDYLYDQRFGALESDGQPGQYSDGSSADGHDGPNPGQQYGHGYGYAELASRSFDNEDGRISDLYPRCGRNLHGGG
ncbi:MAG: DUF11 domain-containing protein [Saprospirales bacterium]|nr:DUF11 domain-containing protein [Saprospirales bacterium]